MIALCLHGLARGQTGYGYDYWFDQDRQTLQSGNTESGVWQLQADVSNLSEALHAIHIQVHDAEGNQSAPVTRYFVRTVQSSSSVGRYWFDDDTLTIYTSPQVQGLFDIDVQHLEEGFHTIWYQVVSNKGNVSSTANRSFYKVYMPSKSRWRCWFDNDFSTVQEGEGIDNTILLDVTDISEGYHLLHIQADGGFGAVSVPITKGFIKIPQTIGVDEFTCLCMIDDHLFKQEKVTTAGGVVAWDFDVSSLPQGFHRIFIQIVTPSGAASSTWQSFFLRETTHDEYDELKCVYAIDGADYYTETGTLTNDAFHFDLDVSSLEDGLHRITYMLSNGKGVTTQAQTQYFTKIPIGGSGITQYEYWLNQNFDTRHVVTLPERQNTYNLISLLPVESQPIRSSCFHFETKSGKPMMYAKNDIHLRFYDASGRFTDAAKQFVDESVKQEVKNIKPLFSGIRETTNRPAENEILWYSLQAQRGDSLTFKVDRACSLQLFSPSGEELYNVSGAESVIFDGSYAPEDGIYYLALHDVMATQGSTISLDYQHIDKYAVLSHTPHEIGVAVSYVEMQLNGNGYDKLEGAYLCTTNDTIYADSIMSDSKSKARLIFEIIGEENTGVYDLYLSFRDGTERDTLVISEAVILSVANFSEIDVQVTTKPTLASPYPVTVSVTNTGNVSLLYTPFNIAFSTGQVESVHFMDFYNYFQYASNDAPFDSIEYCPFVTTDNMFGTGRKGFVWYLLIPQLLPHETKTFVIGFKAPSHAKYDFYAWTGTPLNVEKEVSDSISNIPSVWDYLDGVSTYMQHLSNKGMRKAPDPSRVLNTANRLRRTGSAGINAGRTAAATGATLGGTYNGLSMWQMDQWVDPDDPTAQGALQDYRDRRRNGMPSPGQIGHLAGGPLGAALGFFYGNHGNCANNGPEPDKTSVEQWNPGDPNDIFGYLSEAGSKFIADSVARVHYTIEFENDTTLANASAHTIVIKDTLDSRYFDLTKFMPTGVRIGSREVFLDEADVMTNNNKTSFVKTIDMRPEINAIAQVNGEFNQKNGIAEWHFTSLDPMTMEPAEDVMQGILPVNYNGRSGIGEVMFEIGVKSGKNDGAKINNRASIVFDYEDAILTPTWTNIVDAVAPTSIVNDLTLLNDSTLRVYADANDARSGVWKYEWYVRHGENAPWWKEGETNDDSFDFRFYRGFDYGFCVVAIDSAGNVERKELQPERLFKTYGEEFDDAVGLSPLPASPVGEVIYDLSGRKHEKLQENQVNIVGKKKILFRRKEQ